MKLYVDSGILIKLYVRERNSEEAIRALSQFKFIHINKVHELEIRNTFRALESRQLISPFQRAASEHEFEADFIAGRLKRAALDWDGVYEEAVNLSRLYSAETLARSLDLLHIAAASLSQAELFLTGDKRQFAAAAKAGLAARLIE